jgi:hypothetical protein
MLQKSRERSELSMRDLFLILLVSALAIVYCVFPRRCPAQATGKAAHSRSGIMVDLQSGEADGINLRDPIDKIRAALGSSAVKEETEELEGENTKVDVLSLTDHKVYSNELYTALMRFIPLAFLSVLSVAVPCLTPNRGDRCAVCESCKALFCRVLR